MSAAGKNACGVHVTSLSRSVLLRNWISPFLMVEMHGLRSINPAVDVTTLLLPIY